MSVPINKVRENSPLQGDVERLSEQLGSAGALSLVTPAACEQFARIVTVQQLKDFLVAYRDDRLLAHELPIILRAYQHATRNEALELVALDKSLSNDQQLQSLAAASKHVGRWQLRRLRPLKDVRYVQKYLHALDEGHANGWHTIVFGIVLAVFALPLRQGLVHYGLQTVQSFIHSAAGRLKLTEGECQEILDEIITPFTRGMEQVLEVNGPFVLRLAE